MQQGHSTLFNNYSQLRTSPSLCFVMLSVLFFCSCTSYVARSNESCKPDLLSFVSDRMPGEGDFSVTIVQPGQKNILIYDYERLSDLPVGIKEIFNLSSVNEIGAGAPVAQSTLTPRLSASFFSGDTEASSSQFTIQVDWMMGKLGGRVISYSRTGSSDERYLHIGSIPYSHNLQGAIMDWLRGGTPIEADGEMQPFREDP